MSCQSPSNDSMTSAEEDDSSTYRPTTTPQTIMNRLSPSNQKVFMTSAEKDDPSSETLTFTVVEQYVEPEDDPTTMTTQQMFSAHRIQQPQYPFGQYPTMAPQRGEVLRLSQEKGKKEVVGEVEDENEPVSVTNEPIAGNPVTQTAITKDESSVVVILPSTEPRLPSPSNQTAITKDDKVEVIITVTELPGTDSSSPADPSNQTLSGHGDNNINPQPELLEPQETQQQEYQAPPPNSTSHPQGENNRNPSQVPVETQPGQQQYQVAAPPNPTSTAGQGQEGYNTTTNLPPQGAWQNGYQNGYHQQAPPPAPRPKLAQLAYHDKMPGWTYHDPSPAWSFTHQPGGFLHYDPHPTWSYCDPYTGVVTGYWPGPRLAYHSASQRWWVFDDSPMVHAWVPCSYEQFELYLHPPMHWPHVCPGNAPDWTLHRTWPGPLFSL